MAESFVPQNTKVICTFMTIPSPLELKATKEPKTIYTRKGEPLLNVMDNKMSMSFNCKSAAKMWGGLRALCLGIALGAAIVLTGGLAVAVVITALALSEVARFSQIYHVANDCDFTLQAKWNLYHKKVSIQGERAILNRSFLTCPKGGIVNIIMDPVIAYDAAAKMSSNNNKEILIHMSAQFAMGAIGVITAGAAGAVLAGGIMIGLYVPGELIGEDNGPKVTNAAATVSGEGLTVLAGFAEETGSGARLADKFKGTIVNKNVGNYVRGNYQYLKSLVTESVTDGFEGAVRTVSGKRGIKVTKNLTSIGGLMGNFIIGIVSDTAEGAFAEMTGEIENDSNRRDALNGINVIAIEA